MERTKRIGVFAGSFDPFTIGHDDIVRRALAVVDELHIVVGVNLEKPSSAASSEARVQAIATLYEGDPRIVVAQWAGLTARYAERAGATLLIRGLRTVRDMEAEREMADTHLTHFGLDTIFFFTRPELASISSGRVRELAHFGEPVDRYLPSRR